MLVGRRAPDHKKVVFSMTFNMYINWRKGNCRIQKSTWWPPFILMVTGILQIQVQPTNQERAQRNRAVLSKCVIDTQVTLRDWREAVLWKQGKIRYILHKLIQGQRNSVLCVQVAKTDPSAERCQNHTRHSEDHE